YTDNMVPQVAVRSIRQTLGQSLHRYKFRENRLNQSGFIEKAHTARPVRIDEQLAQLLSNALGANDGDLGRGSLDRGTRGRLDVELKPRRKPDGAEHAQLVLRDARRRIADGPQDLRFQIVLPADIVDELVFHRVEEHAVDREVTAQSVFAGRGEDNRIGM